jgi:hypothetical protein
MKITPRNEKGIHRNISVTCNERRNAGERNLRKLGSALELAIKHH